MLTATTGMDALTHAIEAYIGRSTTKLTRAMSEEAATRIVHSLYKAYDGGDMQARADMLRAAYCAGVSFTRSLRRLCPRRGPFARRSIRRAARAGERRHSPPISSTHTARPAIKKLGRLARIAGVVVSKRFRLRRPPKPSSAGFARQTPKWDSRNIPQIRTVDIPEMAHHAAKESLLNAGQTCVAPDYVLVAREIEDAFVSALQRQFDQLCPDPLHSAEYVHIVNQKHFDRLTGLMASGQIVYGGSIDPAALRIAPTILRNVSPDSPVMQEEIFGPILPILPVSGIDEAIAFAAARPHPLACYLFTKDRAVQRRVLDALPFGGGCINDTIIHLATSRMPFGGVGPAWAACRSMKSPMTTSRASSARSSAPTCAKSPPVPALGRSPPTPP